ncbi:MAG: hypothetical protein IT202_05315 [Fimbriimonadaceae bacterium]|nr:hypothetical protein [Fimbriimonadaceae bacterium]
MKDRKEGLQFIRLMMVLGSLSPLFILWAIAGVKDIPDNYLVATCIAFAILPGLFILLREQIATKEKDFKVIEIHNATDDSANVLVYLFTIAVPLFSVNLESMRSKFAMLGLVVFVIYMYLHLRLFFMNPLYAVRGYRVFTIEPPADGDGIGTRETLIVLSRRRILAGGSKLSTLRLSDTVFLEVEKGTQ